MALIGENNKPLENSNISSSVLQFTVSFDGTAGKGAVGKLNIPALVIPTGAYITEAYADVTDTLVASDTSSAYVAVGIETDNETAVFDQYTGNVDSLNTNGVTQILTPYLTKATIIRHIVASVGGNAITAGEIKYTLTLNVIEKSDTTDLSQKADTAYVDQEVEALASSVNSNLATKLDLVKKPVVTTVAGLRILTSVANDVIYQTTDKGGGQWYYDSSDTSSLDNTGTIIVTPDNRRLKRIFNNSIDVKWFGAVANIDSTTAIQNAINYAAGKYKVLIDESYIVNVEAANSAALIVPSNSHIILGKNGILNLAGTSKTSYGIFYVTNVSNIIIEGGKIIGDRVTHIGTTGESGHGFLIGNLSDNITIKNIDISNCWGDGICLAAFTNTDDASINVIIDNVYSHNNRRQGLSIISAKKVKVINSRFEDTNGTAPQSGIDIEPNTGNVVQDVIIDNCYFGNNTGGGLVVTGNDATALTNNVVVTNCIFKGNIQTSVLVGGVGTVSNILFSDSIIEQSASSTGYALNTAASTNVTVKNANIIADGSSIYAVAKQYGNGITFDNLKIRANTPKIGIGCTYAANNIKIVNCDIDVVNNAIEFLLQAGEIKNNVIIQNNLLKSSGTVGSKCLYISDTYNCEISNNKILGAGYSGIDIYRCGNLNVQKNTIQDAGGFRNLIDACIRIDLTTDSTVQNNYARLGTLYTNKVGYGLIISPSGASGTKNLIVKDNNFLDTFSTIIKNYSTEKNIIQDTSIAKTGITSAKPILDANDVNSDYYDTTLSKFVKWNGSSWITVADSIDLTTQQTAINSKANDSAVVHNSGTETVSGLKTFSSQLTINDGTGITYATGTGLYLNRPAGAYIKNVNTGTAIIVATDNIIFRDSTTSTTFGNIASNGLTINKIVNATGDFVTRNATSGLLNIRSASDVLSDIGLGNVNNTSDINKPISIATQTALDLKANKANPTFTGTAISDKFQLSNLNTAPASATATGTLGEIRITADAIYVCIATNTWVKAALATW